MFLCLAAFRDRDEGDVLFNDGYMGILCRITQNNQTGNPLPSLHRLLYLISRNDCFIGSDKTIHITAFVSPVVEH